MNPKIVPAREFRARLNREPVARLVEQPPFKRQGVGSKPIRFTKHPIVVRAWYAEHGFEPRSS